MGFVGRPRRSIRGHSPVSFLQRIKVANYYFFYSYIYYGQTFAITEMDGVRILGQDSCDLIQKVPGV